MLNLIYKSIQLLRHYRWPKEKVLSYSESMFRTMVRFAFTNSPFYRELYSSHGIKASDLQQIKSFELPVIDKDMVRPNFYTIATRKLNRQDVEESLEGKKLLTRVNGCTIIHSSGSTGKPCNFLYDDDALTLVQANMARISVGGDNLMKIYDLPVRVLYVASVGRGYASTALALNSITNYRAKSIILNVQDPWESWCEKIQRFKPNYVAGYPSCILLIADLQERGKINIAPKKIITGGEPLTVEIQDYLRKVFGADVIDYYGCTESLALGAGFSWYQGIYLFDDINYYETDDHNRLIITPLYNFTFPLIRYRLDDVVEGFSRNAQAPLPFTRINKILGRTEEMMWFKNHQSKWDFLHPLFIDDLDVPGMKQYQFIQIDETSFKLRVVRESFTPIDLGQRIKNQVDSFLTRKNLANVKYTVEFVDDLQLDPLSGKAKLVHKICDVHP